jgi:hypothetical protein
MSDPTSATADKPLFSPVEIEQFDADDVTAGKAIGKMLSLLFLYTVLAMALVTWWTFNSISARNQPPASTNDHTGH